MSLSVLLSVISLTAAAQTPRDTSLIDRSLCDSPSRFVSGRVAGVQVVEFNADATSGSNVLIRGLNSVRTSSQPLWIVEDRKSVV